MNKKLFLLTSIIPAFCLTSCKGFVVYLETAKEILENLKASANIDDYVFDKVTCLFKEVNKDNSREMKIVYDRKVQYLYSYRIENYHIYESWVYSKTFEDKKVITYGNRLDGALNDKGYPAVDMKNVVYSDERWGEIDLQIRQFFFEIYSRSLLVLEKLIDYGIAANAFVMTCSSRNDESLCIETNIDGVEYYVANSNALVDVYNVNYREDKYISLSTDYSKANVTYLNY